MKLGTPSRSAFAGRVRELASVDAQVRALVEPLLTILAAMLRELARLTKEGLDIVRREDICRRLMSAPGVGPITALAFRATIDRPDRFGSSRAVGAHLGPTPAQAAELEQRVPVTTVARQARGLDGHHGTDTPIADGGERLLEARPGDAGPRPPERTP